MNKKKLGTGLIALALVGVVGIGGSLAWFTDTDSKTNTFETKRIDITLTETGYTDDGVYMPGDTFTKNPTITLSEDSAPAYVRIRDVTVKITKQNGSEEERDLENFLPTFDKVDWYASPDGNYYYQKILNPGESTSALFETITIPSNFNNDYVNANIEIVIDAEAVQAANFNNSLATDRQGRITGWLIAADQIQQYVDLRSSNDNN